MKDFLSYLITNITGIKDFDVEEETSGDFTNYKVLIPKESVGLAIGKGGKTVRVIRNLLRVRATLEKKGVALSIEEKAD